MIIVNCNHGLLCHCVRPKRSERKRGKQCETCDICLSFLGIALSVL